MLKNGNIVINLNFVAFFLIGVLLVSGIAGAILCKLGYFSYQPEVQSAQVMEDYPGAYVIDVVERPADGAAFFGVEERRMQYLVLADGSIYTYPDLGSVEDLVRNEALSEALLKETKAYVLSNIIKRKKSQSKESALVSTEK